MIYGLLIGSIIFGLLLFLSNLNPHAISVILRSIGSGFIIIPLFGLIGLLIHGS